MPIILAVLSIEVYTYNDRTRQCFVHISHHYLVLSRCQFPMYISHTVTRSILSDLINFGGVIPPYICMIYITVSHKVSRFFRDIYRHKVTLRQHIYICRVLYLLFYIEHMKCIIHPHICRCDLISAADSKGHSPLTYPISIVNLPKSAVLFLFHTRCHDLENC